VLALRRPGRGWVGAALHVEISRDGVAAFVLRMREYGAEDAKPRAGRNAATLPLMRSAREAAA